LLGTRGNANAFLSALVRLSEEYTQREKPKYSAIEQALPSFWWISECLDDLRCKIADAIQSARQSMVQSAERARLRL
jgi:hypothetical protein